MSGTDEVEVVARRRLLTGGAAAAGAAAGAVALGVVGARPAAAANGDAVQVGKPYSGTTRTSLTVNSATEPALQLANSTGPALKLANAAKNTFTFDLQPGELASVDEYGVVVGMRDFEGTAYTAPVATLDDVLPIPYLEPSAGRLADTRSSAGRAGVKVVSGPGYDAQFRLQAGTTIDVKVDDTTFEYVGVFLNLVSTGSTKGGFLLAYSPAEKTRPTSSSLTYSTGQTIANGTLAGAAVTATGVTSVRVYASSTTHVIVDLTGKLTTQYAGEDPGTGAKSRRSAARRITSRRPARRR